MTTVLLLAALNMLMNIAWYGRLKFKAAPIVLVAWGTAFFEYTAGAGKPHRGQRFHYPQLKGIQEAFSITTFFVISIV